MTRHRSTLAVAFVSLLATCAALAEGCQDATQIVVKVSTNLGCTGTAPSFEGGHLAVYRDAQAVDGSEATLTKDLCKSGGEIGTLTVVPGASGDGATVRVRAAAWLGASVKDAKAKNARECFDMPGAPDCVVSTRSLKFIAHRSLTIPIFLDSACAGVTCPEKKTCGPGGVCIGEAIEEDAGAPDAETDAALVPMVARKIWAGGNGACALLDDGKTIACWGDSSKGQLGTTKPIAPTVVAKLEGATDVGLGTKHLCAMVPGLNATSEIRCFGDNVELQLGVNGTATESQVPRLGLNKWTGPLAAGANHACAVQRVNKSLLPDPVVCWGRAQEGQVDGLTETTSKLPTANPMDMQPQQVVGGDEFTCTLTDPQCGIQQCDSIVCWGSNANGQIAQPLKGPVFLPPIRLDSPLLVDAVALAAGTRHMVAITQKPNNGPRVVVGWGDGAKGQLGAGSKSPLTPTPVVIAELDGADAIVAGDSHTCAIQKNAVVCLGSLGSRKLSAIADDGGAVAIASGRNHVCALTKNNHVFCWGDGSLMQLGGASGPDIAQMYAPR